MPVKWRVVAKDGFDLPARVQVPRLAEQTVGMGETWDVAFRSAWSEDQVQTNYRHQKSIG